MRRELGVADRAERMAWWRDARYGMFICYGLYSTIGLMAGQPFAAHFFNRRRLNVPGMKRMCRRAMARFDAAQYDPEKWVLLAKQAGMRYMVLTTKHVEGFCLWDSRVNEFTAPRSAARRDLVREFVDACRRHDIRIGLYFSLIDVTYESFGQGPDGDRSAWRRFAGDTWEQVRELMTNYGKVDILWYDGTYPAHMKALRMGDLNAEIRRIQPGDHHQQPVRLVRGFRHAGTGHPADETGLGNLRGADAVGVLSLGP